MCIRRLLEVEGYEQGKYHGLDKSNKHFKEIEWNHEYISEWQTSRSNLCSNPEHDTEENSSGKYISEETEWECHDTDEFPYEMEPSNKDIDTFIDESLSLEVKYIVKCVAKNSMKTNHDNVWYEDHENRHTKCRIDIRIYRSEVIVKSWSKCEKPIKEEAIEICPEDVEENSSDEPESFREWEIVSEEWLKERFEIFHDEIACCLEKTWFFFWCEIEYTWEDSHYYDKYPGREHSICDIREVPTFSKCMRRNGQNMWCIVGFHMGKDYRWNLWIASAKKILKNKRYLFPPFHFVYFTFYSFNREL